MTGYVKAVLSMDSNMIAIYLIAIICIGGGMFYFLRKYLKLSKLNKAIMEKKYDQILEMTEEPSVRKILSEFTADLYRLNALRSMNEMDRLKTELNQMLEYYGSKEEKRLLELYYHYFLNHKDHAYAKQLLEVIRETEDEPFIQYNEWAYEVIAEGRTDLASEMEDAVNDKVYSGFALGTVLYLIALQLDRLKEYEDAKAFYQTVTECITKRELYYTLAERRYNELDDLIPEDDAEEDFDDEDED